MVELNGNEEEKAIMNPSASDSQAALQEGFTCRCLFHPRSKTPTSLSGKIVYVSTAVLGKCARTRLASAG